MTASLKCTDTGCKAVSHLALAFVMPVVAGWPPLTQGKRDAADDQPASAAAIPDVPTATALDDTWYLQADPASIEKFRRQRFGMFICWGPGA